MQKRGRRGPQVSIFRVQLAFRLPLGKCGRMRLQPGGCLPHVTAAAHVRRDAGAGGMRTSAAPPVGG